MNLSQGKPSSVTGVLHIAAACLVSLTLSGCLSTPAKPEAKDDTILASLDKAIERNRSDVPTFTAASTAKPAPAKEQGPALSLDYPGGDARVLLARLASANGLRFSVVGPQPHMPLFVSVHVKDVPFIDVLRDIGEQFGERADLVVSEKSIEIQYRDK